MKIIVGVTGASGVVLAKKLIDELKKTCEVHVILSESAKKVTAIEIKGDSAKSMKGNFNYSEKQMDATVSSSSNLCDAMVVVPCSMKTLSSIAHGFENNLITRCAHIFMRCKKPLVIVPRETPLDQIQIENMLKCSRAGAIILPPVPGFYTNPKSVDDITNFVVGKILDCLEIKNDIYKRWKNTGD
ncbi:MAG: UbiX family flavin prenyltransferase [Candidatus Diapherotrites archaeon]|nr:UbiX family flavin prenyltransferase [Candidatus Diapherotrites archaeon]